MATRYVPDAGDIVRLEYDPQAGAEVLRHARAKIRALLLIR